MNKTATRSAESAVTTPAGGLGEQRLHQIVGYQLAQATTVATEVFQRVVGTPLGLRPLDYTILMLVQENAGGSPAQLSRALDVARPNITLRLDVLESRGLLVREQNTRDRRGQHLRTTKVGGALATKATAALADAEREAFTTLSVAEMLMLTELLHKLARARTK